MLGARPNTQWLNNKVCLDEAGFVYTGGDLLKQCQWQLTDRQPEPLETSLPGVFAIGDVRSGSIKRVASAVGEGSVCVQYMQRVLNAQKLI
jgi:thioredoxin reductase (NADPH)